MNAIDDTIFSVTITFNRNLDRFICESNLWIEGEKFETNEDPIAMRSELSESLDTLSKACNAVFPIKAKMVERLKEANEIMI